MTPSFGGSPSVRTAVAARPGAVAWTVYSAPSGAWMRMRPLQPEKKTVVVDEDDAVANPMVPSSSRERYRLGPAAEPTTTILYKPSSAPDAGAGLSNRYNVGTQSSIASSIALPCSSVSASGGRPGRSPRSTRKPCCLKSRRWNCLSRESAGFARHGGSVPVGAGGGTHSVEVK